MNTPSSLIVNVMPTLSREFVAAAKLFLDTMAAPPADPPSTDYEVGANAANSEWQDAMAGVVAPGNDITPTGVAAYITALQARLDAGPRTLEDLKDFGVGTKVIDRDKDTWTKRDGDTWEITASARGSRLGCLRRSAALTHWFGPIYLAP